MAVNGTQNGDHSAHSDITSRKPENIGVFTNPEHELYVKSSTIPTAGPGQCLIHVRATGICGSDVHFWKKGHIGDMVVTGENCLGHESAGEVIAVGEGVTKFKPGKLNSFQSTPSSNSNRSESQVIGLLLNAAFPAWKRHATFVGPDDTTHARMWCSSQRLLTTAP